jgi:hypothetical protein
MDHYSKSRNDFIRSGVARNPALPERLVDALMRDSSHTVWTGLAANPGLAAKTLMQLHEMHDLEWSWFAMNPACPPEVEQVIRASGDADAIQWLERTKGARRGWPVERPVASIPQ